MILFKSFHQILSWVALFNFISRIWIHLKFLPSFNAYFKNKTDLSNESHNWLSNFPLLNIENLHTSLIFSKSSFNCVLFPIFKINTKFPRGFFDSADYLSRRAKTNFFLQKKWNKHALCLSETDDLLQPRLESRHWHPVKTHA